MRANHTALKELGMARSNMLFDVLANILQTKSMELYKAHIASEEFKDASPYMVRRYLTMCMNNAVRDVVLDNYLALERMPSNIQYLWLMKAVPKQKSTFIQYIR